MTTNTAAVRSLDGLLYTTVTAFGQSWDVEYAYEASCCKDIDLQLSRITLPGEDGPNLIGYLDEDLSQAIFGAVYRECEKDWVDRVASANEAMREIER